MSYLCCHVTSLKHSASEREIVSSLRDDFALASGGQGLEFMYKLGDFVRVDANSEGGLLGSGHVVGVVNRNASDLLSRPRPFRAPKHHGLRISSTAMFDHGIRQPLWHTSST